MIDRGNDNWLIRYEKARSQTISNADDVPSGGDDSGDEVGAATVTGLMCV